MIIKKVIILGAEYTIKIIENKDEITEDVSFLKDNWGFTRYYTKSIYIDATPSPHNYENNEYYHKERIKEIIRHEIIHAFLLESGLSSSTEPVNAWAKNDEMVDWFAMQSPKIFKVFEKLDLM